MLSNLFRIRPARTLLGIDKKHVFHISNCSSFSYKDNTSRASEANRGGGQMRRAAAR